jgi:hypothetical protein
MELSDQERQNRFIEKGYESSYSAQNNDDFEAFIQTHGTPEMISRKSIVNQHDQIKDEMITLSYKNYDMRYYAYSKRELWHPPKALLMAVLSKEGGKYLFGVELGMERQKVREILGLADTEKQSIDFSDQKGHKVMLSFKGNTLSEIIWDYSGE